MRHSDRVPGSRPDPLAALVIVVIAALSLTLMVQARAGADDASGAIGPAAPADVAAGAAPDG